MVTPPSSPLLERQGNRLGIRAVHGEAMTTLKPIALTDNQSRDLGE
jgi:hypothetical protein